MVLHERAHGEGAWSTPSRWPAAFGLSHNTSFIRLAAFSLNHGFMAICAGDMVAFRGWVEGLLLVVGNLIIVGSKGSSSSSRPCAWSTRVLQQFYRGETPSVGVGLKRQTPGAAVGFGGAGHL